MQHPNKETTRRAGSKVKSEVNQTDTTPMVVEGPRPTVGDDIGEGVGGVSGALAGAAIGALGGPIGILVGGIAGAVGGWWSGRAISEAAGKYSKDDETYFRRHYDTSGKRTGHTFEEVQPVYQYGHLAGQNPDYTGRDFDAVEGDLARGWTDDLRGRYGDWGTVRTYAREGYTRSRADLAERAHDRVLDAVSGDLRGDHSVH